MTITPTQFRDAFCRVASTRKKDLVRYWKGNNTFYSKTIFAMLPEIATELTLSVYPRDYYTLDAVFYLQKDTEHFPESMTYVKKIEVAFEHENQLAGSEAEMNKLQLFSAPLKVLVTYATDKYRQQYLERYTKIIRCADAFSDIGTLRRQLVIFGELVSDQPRWYSYQYEQEGFVEI
jgi:hypothetical protein